MAYQPYQHNPPDLAELQSDAGLLLLEFGAPWCGHCRATEPLVAEALSARSDIRHLKVEDGRGKRLGRQFGVKLWPTLILLRDGEEQARVVRPATPEALDQLFIAI